MPVVFHVVYNPRHPEQNISDEQIRSQIDVLNLDFRKQNSDLSSVPEAFRRLAGDAWIEFELANTVRKQTQATSFTDDDKVKFSASGGADAWPSDQYLNIWVCSLQGLLGYAQFPGGPAETDGVVINHTACGTTGTAAAPFNLGRTATHEIGHWLNLYHIWGDDGTGCNGDDFVDDTPNQAGPNEGMPTFPHVTCGNAPNGDMFHNFLDYTDDAGMCMFTVGQVTRMHATLDGVRSILGTGPRARRPAREPAARQAAKDTNQMHSPPYSAPEPAHGVLRESPQHAFRAARDADQMRRAPRRDRGTKVGKKINPSLLDRATKIALLHGLKNGDLEVKDGGLALGESASSVVRRSFRRTCQEFAPEISPRSRAPGRRDGDAALVAEQRINEKYGALGAQNSPLGLPLYQGITSIGPDSWWKEYRGGFIRIDDPLGAAMIQALQTTILEIYWKGLQAEVVQEATDEVYGVVGLLIPSRAQVGALAYPDDRQYWDFANNWDFIERGDLLYSGPPADLTLTFSHVEHDSGDTREFQRQIAQRLTDLAGKYLQSQGVPAEEVAKTDFFIEEVIYSLISAIVDILGTADDAYTPDQKLIRWADIPTFGWGNEPTLFNYAHSVYGVDQGDDQGRYTYFFEMRNQLVANPL